MCCPLQKYQTPLIEDITTSREDKLWLCPEAKPIPLQLHP